MADASNDKGSVEVLPDLGNYPIREGPGVHPGDAPGTVAALDEDGGAKAGDWLRKELEVVVGGGIAGEHAHQKLVRWRSVEPPLEIRGHDLDHRVGVAGV